MKTHKVHVHVHVHVQYFSLFYKPERTYWNLTSQLDSVVIEVTSVKMQPVIELMNIPSVTFVRSTQSSAATEQKWHH